MSLVIPAKNQLSVCASIAEDGSEVISILVVKAEERGFEYCEVEFLKEDARAVAEAIAKAAGFEICFMAIPRSIA